ncbi:5'-nucleotidase [Catenovulum agarivorans DS-2]|uniref:5'-deoxynucleotidase n=1 Tax=Catenovulum agarivorans DS-2 TaxID=1328313 RepID=W7QD99_9ALTE|nr:5'-deoxynucleotidase [Catenovulum agarivorans]EWH09891.1 5'-nucleotidase [Catenovulum agarivorans DS-2]
MKDESINPSHFFAYMARMKLINRWPLMRNTQIENVQEHSLQVAMIAHALAVIRNEYYQGNANPERIATLAIFHDASEVLTGDLPNPVKYFNAEIAKEYKKIEKIAEDKLVGLLPERLQKYYQPLVCSEHHNPEEYKLVKAADILSAYLKTIEELNAGNHEFSRAQLRLQENLQALEMPEVEFFLNMFEPGFSLSLDAITE